jgi:hypothetical protein
MKNVAFNTISGQFVAGSAANVVVLKNEADLEKLDTKVLVAMYNANREVPIKKFETRAKAVQRVAKMIAEREDIPELKVEVKVAKVSATAAHAKVSVKAKVSAEGKAVDRIVKFGATNTGFTLDQAEKQLGIKQGCLRTHMSFINSHGEVFGHVKFVGDRKTKTYTMQLPKAA